MILRRILAFSAALAAVAAAAAVCVVALACAAYALALPWLGPAGAAAATAGIFALGALILAAIAVRKADPGKALDDAAMLDRLLKLAQEKPLVAASAAGAVLLAVLRNPRVLSALIALITAALAGKRAPAAGSKAKD